MSPSWLIRNHENSQRFSISFSEVWLHFALQSEPNDQRAPAGDVITGSRSKGVSRQKDMSLPQLRCWIWCYCSIWVMLKMLIMTIPNDSSILYGHGKRKVCLFLLGHQSSFSPESHVFWFLIRCTVIMVLGSSFSLMSIMWTFSQRLKPGSLRWELVNHPKQWKQPGLALASVPADWTNVGNGDVRNCWMWQITMTGAGRSYWEHHEEWLSFTGGSEGVMWEMDKPP